MKKFSLKRCAAFGTAAVLAITLSGCAKENDSGSKYAGTVYAFEQVEKNTSEEKNLEFVYDQEAPIAIPIEPVTMADGSTGYKMPIGYHAYQIDDSLPLPGMCPVLELTDEYVILGGCDVTSLDTGITTYRGFEGSVAVYHPYYYLLRMAEDPHAFNVFMDEAKETLGEQSLGYQMYLDVANGKAYDAISDIYYSNVESKQR